VLSQGNKHGSGGLLSLSRYEQIFASCASRFHSRFSDFAVLVLAQGNEYLEQCRCGSGSRPRAAAKTRRLGRSPLTMAFTTGLVY